MPSSPPNSSSSTQYMDIDYLLKKGKRSAPWIILQEIKENRICTLSGSSSGDSLNDVNLPSTSTCESGRRGSAGSERNDTLLNQMLDHLLDPRKPITNEAIDWLRWLISAGRSPDEFSNEMKKYDTATCCGLVWTANFVAYRCRTCGISPCMSLCAECFKRGNHEGHDFNMFRSQAGGACDCGDPSVMKESGFCSAHGPGKVLEAPSPSEDLLIMPRAMIPKLIHRLIVALRKNNQDGLKEAEIFITDFLNKLPEMGAAMRSVLTEALIDTKLYSSLSSYCSSAELEISNLYNERYKNYLQAKAQMPNFHPCSELKEFYDMLAFQKELAHNSFLEELLFWTIVYEFSQKMVTFLLNMLPDGQYKDFFAQSFVHHYSRVSTMLSKSRESQRAKNTVNDVLSNCVVHVSVQLFSNEDLADRLCEQMHLMHVMVLCLKAIIEGTGCEEESGLGSSSYSSNGILMLSEMQDPKKNLHNVVRCDHPVMKEHLYWPIVSDLNNILTHRPVSFRFLSDCNLIEMWLELIMAFQGMNLNTRQLAQHVEYENNAYYAAFSAELEICSTPMWTLISHLKDESSRHLTESLLKNVEQMLQTWFELIDFKPNDAPNQFQCTFHIPLHRYYAAFLHHALQNQNAQVHSLFPTANQGFLKQLLAHPLQCQVNFYEIHSGLWVRNGLQIKGQAMTYAQCHFCNSMIDMDLFLIQMCASYLEEDWFIKNIFERFHVWEWLSMSSAWYEENCYHYIEPDHLMSLLEGALVCLSQIVTISTNLGLGEEQITRKELVTLLAMSDRTHSQLTDSLPEKCGATTSHTPYFETLLTDVADFRAPHHEAGGNLIQGMFYPKAAVWEEEYDPLLVLLRAVHRKDYQTSLDRYMSHVRRKRSLKDSQMLWPPFRIKKEMDTPRFGDPRKILKSKVLHGALFSILYKAVHQNDVSDHVLALTIFLLELCISDDQANQSNSANNETQSEPMIYSPSADSNSESSDQAPSISISQPSTSSSPSSNPNPDDAQDLKFGSWFKSSSIIQNMNINIDEVKVRDHRMHSVLLRPNIVEEMEVETVSDTNEDTQTGDDVIDFDSDDENNATSYQVISPAVSETGEPTSGFTGHNAPNSVGHVPNLENPSQSGQQPQLEAPDQRPQLPTSTVPLALPAPRVSSMTLSPVFDVALMGERRVATQSNDTQAAASTASGSEQRPAILPPPPPRPLTNSNLPLGRRESAPASTGDDTVMRYGGGGSGITGAFTEHYANGRLQRTRSFRLRPVNLAERRRFMQNRRRERLENRNQDSQHRYHHMRSFSTAGSGSEENFQTFSEIWGALPSSSTVSVKVNESLLTLLVKLHSRLTGSSDSFKPDKEKAEKGSWDDEYPESRVGDGSFFVSKVLVRYMTSVPEGERIINEIRFKLWPDIASRSSDTHSADIDKEERRRRAKERQQKLMAEFASRQQAFLNKMNNEGKTEECSSAPSSSSSQASSQGSEGIGQSLHKVEYDCCICGQSGPTTPEKLFGQVVLLQSTSVLGHQSIQPVSERRLPTSQTAPLLQPNEGHTLGYFIENRIDEFSQHFSENSWLNSLNIGWVGGVYVQSCGHFLHLDCHKAYVDTLRRQNESGMRHNTFEHGDYLCPLCRQQANSVVPISPDLGSAAALVKCRSNDLHSVATELRTLLATRPEPEPFLKLVQNFGEDLTRATGPQYRSVRASPSTKSLYLFLCSIARTNLEIELLVRLNNCMPCGAKKSCFVHLFHILAHNAKPFIDVPYDLVWSQVTGSYDEFATEQSLKPLEKEVPFLLRDVSAILIQLFFALPLNIDKAYFTCITQALFNLNLVQVASKLTCNLSDEQRVALKIKTSIKMDADLECDKIQGFSSLLHLLGFIVDCFGEAGFYPSNDLENDFGIGPSYKRVYSESEFNDYCMKGCLPFLRTAAMLQHQLYSQPFPETCKAEKDSPDSEMEGDEKDGESDSVDSQPMITDHSERENMINEFTTLVKFLGIGSSMAGRKQASESAQSFSDVNVSSRRDIVCFFEWACSDPRKAVKTWIQGYLDFYIDSPIAAKRLLRIWPHQWHRPSLLRLPHTYDEIFMFYHQKECRNCHRVPKDPAICLICGTLVCMRDTCCRKNHTGPMEAVGHSESCGAGTSIFLAINSSSIIVIRGKRACVWGSVFLDSFGEEDRDLKRGKPLYLNAQRYWLLEQQWLTHSFDHTNKRWVLHKDSL